MNARQFRAAIEQTLYAENMKAALRLVVVKGFRQSVAAKRVGVSRQAVHQALMSFYSKHPEAIPRTPRRPVSRPSA